MPRKKTHASPLIIRLPAPAYTRPAPTNMMDNRHYAAQLFSAGWAPADIAARWPKIWRCVGGKLARQPWIKESTPYTMAGVADALADGPPKLIFRKVRKMKKEG